MSAGVPVGEAHSHRRPCRRQPHEPVATFAAEVVDELDVHALLACPITADGAALGVLELYRRAPGAFTSTQVEAALSAAAALGTTVLAELQIYDGDLDESRYRPPQGSFRFARADVNVAIGILSVRLGVSVSDAAAVLRSHAYARSRSVSSIAHGIVEGREMFDVGD
ncbi:MAG: ANTAR domain-containing protein [Rhodococcus sp. (in: high G+C Gram-positive bacteria)]|nr:ANTAR domain-containing protein [Rhodococcus sp. (in: high G+C Gram-positive bacteria)]